MDFLAAYDLGTLYAIGGQRRPWLDPVVHSWTHLGDSYILLVVVALAALGFALVRRPRAAFALPLTFCLARLLTYVLKRLIDRPRPDVFWRSIDLPPDPSFPSSHSLDSMAVYALLGFLLAQHLEKRWQKGVVMAAGVGVSMLVGGTRVYLGVHYPLDVLGGWLAGLVLALLASELARKNAGGQGVEAPPAGSPSQDHSAQP